MAYSILWRIHAVMMASSFAAMLTGVVISLALKPGLRRFRAHRSLGIYAGVSGTSALILAFITVQVFSGVHFTSLHTAAGGFTGLLLIGVPLAGYRISKVKKKKQLKLAHRVLGFITLAAMAVTILLGLQLTGYIALS